MRMMMRIRRMRMGRERNGKSVGGIRTSNGFSKYACFDGLGVIGGVPRTHFTVLPDEECGVVPSVESSLG